MIDSAVYMNSTGANRIEIRCSVLLCWPFITHQHVKSDDLSLKDMQIALIRKIDIQKKSDT